MPAPAFVGTIKGNRPGARAIALRADMDALSIEEKTGLPYASREPAPLTSTEDFSFMLEQRPGAMIMIGNGMAPDGTYHYVHTPHYDFNDQILAIGAAYRVALVNEELGV